MCYETSERRENQGALARIEQASQYVANLPRGPERRTLVVSFRSLADLVVRALGN